MSKQIAPNRRFFTLAVLESNREVALVWQGIRRHFVQTLFEMYGDCDLSELQVIVERFNAP
jgi:hypothetical protein